MGLRIVIEVHVSAAVSFSQSKNSRGIRKLFVDNPAAKNGVLIYHGERIMKTGLSLIVLLLVVCPAYAQETGFPALTLVQKDLAIGVDCDAGDTIRKALKDKRTDLVIFFLGTCEEDVVINRNNVTLRGVLDNATIQGGINVTAANGVFLRDFTVRDSAANGIAVVSNSSANINNVTIDSSAASGIVVAGGSQLFLSGRLVSSNNAQGGIIITNSSNLTGSGAVLELTDNFLGLVIQLASSATLLGGSITATGNVDSGILLASGATLFEGFITITSTENGTGGSVTDNSSWTTVGAGVANRTFSENATDGLRVANGSVMDFRGSSTTLEENGATGLFLEDASGFFDNVTANENPDDDVVITFGSRTTFGGDNDVGVVFCDGTELNRGNVPCPDLSAIAPVKSRKLPRRGPVAVHLVPEIGTD